MTNWKDNENSEGKPKKKKKTRPQKVWKKIENVNKCVSTLKSGLNDDTTNQPSNSGQTSGQQAAQEEHAQSHSNDSSNNNAEESGTPKLEGEVKKIPRANTRSRLTATRSESVIQEPIPECDDDDPTIAFKQHVYEVVKNAFSLACTEDGSIKINVDNIFPLLRAFGLNPQSESVVDLVREACMESYGDIDPADFEKVILTLTKRIDEELWSKRLVEKELLFRVAEAEKEKLESERLRREEEIKKVGFEKEEDDQDEWEAYEKKKKGIEEAKIKENKEDELYDNMKMAFRFIDSDEDGVISTQDLYTLMMGLGEMLTDDELFGMVNVVDQDCDGKVTFEDFKTFMVSQSGEEVMETSGTEESKVDLAPEIDGDKTDETVATTTDVVETTTETETTNKPEKNEEETHEQKEKLKRRKTSMLWGYTAVVPVQNVETNKPEKVEEETHEQKEKLKRRKTSMLWGYTAVVPTETQKTTDTDIENEKNDEVFQSETQAKTPEINIEYVTATDDQQSEVTTHANDVQEVNGVNDAQEVNGQLDAIREEDEHSNYDMEHNVPSNNKTEAKTTTVVENKRKLFSRQSSSASLKTRPSSAITGTESIGDSGIDTLDTMCGSEIREQPDVFDISDEESELDKHMSSPRTSTIRRNSKSPCDIYSGNEDGDEDMIDAHHVYESLSRAASSGSPESPAMNDKENSYAEERTRNFVHEHMYIEIPEELTDEVVEEARKTEERLTRAQTLQKAILRRSNTAPLLTVYSSQTHKPQTPKPSVDGMVCSHIEIDLTCDASPPKADIKSFRQYSARIRSARSSKNDYDATNPGYQVSVIDVGGETLHSKEILSSRNDLSKFPMRPLTRPRSPVFIKKVFARAESPEVSNSMEHLEIRGITSERPKRAKSAVDYRRPTSPSMQMVSKNKQPLKRPQTANIPYTGCKRIDVTFSKIEKKDKFSVVVSQPFKNSNDLYPNKSALTSNHHGFKSIWPIGRNINVMHTKRPFSAFEMNSYSRSVERNQFPFRPNQSKNVGPCHDPDHTKGQGHIATPRSLMKLDLNASRMTRPDIKKASVLVTQRFRPKSVRL